MEEGINDLVLKVFVEVLIKIVDLMNYHLWKQNFLLQKLVIYWFIN